MIKSIFHTQNERYEAHRKGEWLPKKQRNAQDSFDAAKMVGAWRKVVSTTFPTLKPIEQHQIAFRIASRRASDSYGNVATEAYLSVLRKRMEGK